ncbi:hypothetical protein K443DRAFT_85634 [Laccaria amethystina LaAM-08-1]|uniref:Charged multivesicular body protein 7 n=1 Tax=Laccaria amethystina LaAM-08-1 TaxID=1095629 RepID=A0A0C9XTD9_9AGAR|nr:hypothetical protein K443DRAFT_85634 [Laccaria amethystina LaAM-08-1]
MSLSSPSPPSSSSSPLFALPPYSTTSPSRFQALYSDFFRQRNSNPTSFHSNVEWWGKALETLVGSGFQDSNNRLVLNAGRSLMERVKVPRVGKPLALGAVINELHTSKSLIQVSDFLNAKVSIYDPGWLPMRIAAYLVGKPLWWALEQIGIIGEEGSKSHQHTDTGWWGDYVIVSLMERAADAVEEKQRERMGGPGEALYTTQSFRLTFTEVLGVDDGVWREIDTKVLLRFLERDRVVIVTDNDTIKFVDGAGSSTITVVDRGILELKTAVHNLRAQVDALHFKIDDCTRKASSALQQKRKPLALSYIRSRKHLEDLLSKRLGSLSTLEATLITVEAAAGDVEIMNSYESSTATLKAILAHPSLQRSSIDKTMEALAEANVEAREVDDAIRIGGEVGIGDDINDDEVEEEWKALVREAESGVGVEGRLYGEEMKVPSESPELKVAERSGMIHNSVNSSAVYA